MIKTKIFIGVLAAMMLLYGAVSGSCEPRRLYRLTVIAFAVYCCTLLWFTIFSREQFDEPVVRLVIRRFISVDYGPDGNPTGLKFNPIYEQTWLNILLFIPLGYLFPLVARSAAFWNTVGFGCILSAFIELIQYLTRRGWCDVDDVFLNMIGTIIGYGFIRLWMRLNAGEKNDG